MPKKTHCQVANVKVETTEEGIEVDVKVVRLSANTLYYQWPNALDVPKDIRDELIRWLTDEVAMERDKDMYA